MAAFIYDGKSNLAVNQTDTVVLNLDPTLFTQATSSNGNVVLQFGANTLTIGNASLTASALSNISLAGGQFSVGAAAGPSNSANSLVIGTDGANAGFTTGTTAADSKNALFGGTGISSPNDGADTFTIGGKGSFLVYGNAGADTIRQGTNGNDGAAFDSTSAVTVFAGKDDDTVTLQTAANKGSLLVLGGEGADTIKVVNAGNTTIFGGTGAGDSTDGADKIGLGGSGGTITVFGNAGDDFINGDAAANLTNGTAFADGTKATLYGGKGNDQINATFANNAKGTLTIYGGEDADNILVANKGTTVIYGGTGAGDSTDGADTIGLGTGGVTGGTVTVYANAGNDIVSGDGTANTATQFADGVNAAIYGGKGNDTINLGYTANAKGTITVFGGEDADSVTVANTAGSTLTVYGGTGQGDATDGADTITITGQGTATVFGNGGADSINLTGFTGLAGSASANVVTVYGGTGNDSINLGNTTNGTATFNLSGNEGNDTFIIGATGGKLETGTVTFANADLAAGNSVTVGGLTLTATGTVTQANVAAAFANLQAGATTGNTTTNATFSGQLNTEFKTNAAANGAITFTSLSENNPTDLTVGGSNAPTISNVTQGVSSQSTGNSVVTITDFTGGADKLTIQNGIDGTGTATITVTPNGGFSDLQSALNGAVAGATRGTVSVVGFGGNAYVVTNNDGNATFNASTDVAIKLTGVTDLNSVANSITVL